MSQLSKTEPGKSWKVTEKRKKLIVRLLDEGSKSFSELHRKLRPGRHGWSKVTLTLCLRQMEKEEHSIKKEPKGKRWVYTLVKNHSLMARRLSVPVDLNLKQLDEKAFITSWCNSLNFAFAAFLNNLTMLAQSNDTEKLEDQMQSDIEDFTDVLNLVGNILAKKIKTGTFKPEKLRESREEILR